MNEISTAMEGNKIKQHPLRAARLHVYKFFDGDKSEGGSEFVARFHPYKAFPIFFNGKTFAAVRDAAEAFRAEALEKHEKAFLARQDALLRARKAKKKPNSGPDITTKGETHA